MQGHKKMLLDCGGLTCGGPTYMYLLRLGGSGSMLPQDIFVICMLCQFWCILSQYLK